MEIIDFTKTMNLLIEKLDSWFESSVKLLPNLIMAIFVAFIFIFVAKYLRRLTRVALNRATSNEAIGELSSRIVWLVFLSFGMFTALEIVGLDKAVTSLLAGLGIIGIALGFAFQDIATNFMAGILIAIQRPYKVGDVVKVADFHGEVTIIELRTTRIKTFDGLEVIVPNKNLFTDPLINFTSTPDRRLTLQVGISYAEDLSRVEKITKDCLSNIRGISTNRPIDIFYTGFGSSSIDFVVHLWIIYPGDRHFYKAPHDAILAIKKAYDENDILIPFPIRTLEFGAKGGNPVPVFANPGGQ